MDIWANIIMTVTAIDENEVRIPRAVLKTTQLSDFQIVVASFDLQFAV
jgi:hypothetical protein